MSVATTLWKGMCEIGGEAHFISFRSLDRTVVSYGIHSKSLSPSPSMPKKGTPTTNKTQSPKNNTHKTTTTTTTTKQQKHQQQQQQQHHQQQQQQHHQEEEEEAKHCKIPEHLGNIRKRPFQVVLVLGTKPVQNKPAPQPTPAFFKCVGFLTQA